MKNVSIFHSILSLISLFFRFLCIQSTEFIEYFADVFVYQTNYVVLSGGKAHTLRPTPPLTLKCVIRGRSWHKVISLKGCEHRLNIGFLFTQLL